MSRASPAGAPRGARRRSPARRVRATPAAAHGAAAPRPVGCALITVSDTRGPREDASGDRIARALGDAGHALHSRVWVRDEVGAIRRAVRAALGRRGVDVVLLTGGTGASPRDVTPEAVGPLFERRLPGFGELFRRLSYDAIGPAAWLSRAEAGIARDRLVVLLPGSTHAVGLALDEVLLPELAHLVRLLGRFQDTEG